MDKQLRRTLQARQCRDQLAIKSWSVNKLMCAYLDDKVTLTQMQYNMWGGCSLEVDYWGFLLPITFVDYIFSEVEVAFHIVGSIVCEACNFSF